MKIVFPKFVFTKIIPAIIGIFIVYTGILLYGVFFSKDDCFSRTEDNDSTYCKSLRESVLQQSLRSVESVWESPHDIGEGIVVKERYVSEGRFIIHYFSRSFSIIPTLRDRSFSKVHEWICESHSGANFIVKGQKVPNRQIIEFIDGRRFSAVYSTETCDDDNKISWVEIRIES